MDFLLRTGDAARILGMSRQHVVDLCDRGEIEHVRIGTHRRIPRSELDKIARADITSEDLQILRLHQALITPLLTNPHAVIAKAQQNLSQPDDTRGCYPEEWARILESGLDTIIEVLTSPTPAALALRAHSPFTDVLPDRIRRRVLRTCERHDHKQSTSHRT